jgi:hypothetical protein
MKVGLLSETPVLEDVGEGCDEDGEGCDEDGEGCDEDGG